MTEKEFNDWNKKNIFRLPKNFKKSIETKNIENLKSLEDFKI
jgi:hypothetical protein